MSFAVELRSASGFAVSMDSGPPPVALDPPTIRESVAPVSGLSASTTSAAEAGDLVIAFTYAFASSVTLTLQGGWTELAAQSGTPDGKVQRIAIAARVASSGGVQSYQAYTSAASDTFTGLLVLSGYASDWATSTEANTASADTADPPDPPSVTPGAAGSLIVAVGGWALSSPVTAITPPSGYTEQFEIAGSSAFELSVATLSTTSASAANPGAFADDQTSIGWVAATLAFLGVPEPIEAEASITLGDVTVASVGELAITGTAAITLGAVTVASVATLDIAAASAVTLGAVTVASASTLDIAAAAAIALGDVTASSAATLSIEGTAAVTLGAVTVSSAATLDITGAAAVTLGDVTATSAATLSIDAAAAITLGAVTVTSAATLDIAATAAITLGDVTLVSEGEIEVTGIDGSLAVTLGDVTVTSTATLDIAGALAVTLGAVSTTSAATLDIAATAAGTLGAITVASTATLDIAGEASIALDAVTVSSAATLDITGSASITLGAITSSGVAAVVSESGPQTTTIPAIRDRIASLIVALTPTSHADRPFLAYRGEGDGSFTRWAQSAQDASFRRIQVRASLGLDVDTHTHDIEGRTFDVEILVAYPQTSRAGSRAVLDRDALINRDRRLIEKTVGLAGWQNYGTAYPFATFVGGSSSRVPGAGVDFLVIRQTMRFDRAREAA